MKTLFTFVNLMLLAAAGYLGFQVYREMTAASEPAPLLRTETAAGPEVPDRESARPLKDYEAIADRNLFQTRPATPPPPVESKAIDLNALEKTELKLKLWGTVAGSGEEAYAVIEDLKEKRQDLYRVGDSVQKAAIKIILREKVILSVAGRDQVLTIQDMHSDTRAGPQPPGTARGATSRPAAAPKKGAAHPAPRKAVSRSELQKAAGSREEMMKQVRLRPYYRKGRPAGMSLMGVRSGSVFRRLGLRNGDVLLQVNGRAVISAADAGGLHTALQDGESLSIQVKRRGREKTLEYTLE